MHIIHVFYKCRLTCSWRLESARVGAARQPEGVGCYPSLHSGGEGLIRQLDTVAAEDLKRLIQINTHTIKTIQLNYISIKPLETINC